MNELSTIGKFKLKFVRLFVKSAISTTTHSMLDLFSFVNWFYFFCFSFLPF